MTELLKINETLMNLPAGIVIALFAISVGYTLKSAKFFPNERIPFVVVHSTALMFPLIRYYADVAEKVSGPLTNIPRNAIIGYIIGFIAWRFHAKILKRFIDPKFFTEDQPTPSTPPIP